MVLVLPPVVVAWRGGGTPPRLIRVGRWLGKRKGVAPSRRSTKLTRERRRNRGCCGIRGLGGGAVMVCLCGDWVG